MRLDDGSWSDWKGWHAEGAAALGFVSWDEFRKNGYRIPDKAERCSSDDHLGSFTGSTQEKVSEKEAPLPAELPLNYTTSSPSNPARSDDISAHASNVIGFQYQSLGNAANDGKSTSQKFPKVSEVYDMSNDCEPRLLNTNWQTATENSATTTHGSHLWQAHQVAQMNPSSSLDGSTVYQAVEDQNVIEHSVANVSHDQAFLTDASYQPYTTSVQDESASGAAISGTQGDFYSSKAAMQMEPLGPSDFLIAGESSFDPFLSTAADFGLDLSDIAVPSEEEFRAFGL